MRHRLAYAKVIDRDELNRRGGNVDPGLDSVVHVDADPPAEAASFLVIRSWEPSAEFTERWRIVDPNGQTIRTSLERTVLPEAHRVEDEVTGQEFAYTDDDYALVLEADGAETARVRFAVTVRG